MLLLTGQAFCGCAHRQEASKAAAMDVVQPGQEITWADGSVLTVTKREGSALEGIRVVRTIGNGKVAIIVADKGTISKGADPNSVTIILYEAETQTENNQMRAHLMTLAFSR